MPERRRPARPRPPHPFGVATGELRRRLEVSLSAWRPAARRLIERDLRVLAAAEPGRRGIQVWERRHASQNGEDGIIAELVARVGAPGRFAVEIGASDGVENCTRHLVEAGGWTAAWFEGDPVRVASARERFGHLDVRITQALVAVEDVGDLLAAADVPSEPDLLVIDVDGNDLWLWQEIARAHRPRIVVVEYNGAFPPPMRWVARYDPGRQWDTTRDHGASLQSLHDLARSLGYCLVGCDSVGVNSFWVREDLAEPVRHLVGAPHEHYAPPRYVPGSLGHPRRPVTELAMPPLTEPEAAAARLHGFRLLGPGQVGAGQSVFGLVTVRNGSDRTLSSVGEHPVRVALRWRGPDGQLLADEPLRSDLTRPIRPGGAWEVGLEGAAPAVAGSYRVAPALVQEGVRWWDGEAPTATVEVLEAGR